MRDANNLITFSFVTFYSEYLILDKLEKYKQFNSVVVENSFNSYLKKKFNLKYPNVNFIIPKKNLGYGSGNNLAISNKKKYKRYKSRFSGLLSSMIGRSSYFRVEMLK